MARARRKTFIDLLGSPATLIPFVLGVGAAIVLWALSDQHHFLAAFLAVAGSLGALGTLATLLVLNPGGVEPALAKRRREMAAVLAELTASATTPTREADQMATAALTERA